MLYEVTLEVDGVAYVTVEAESEEEAARIARRKAAYGDAAASLDYECVKVTPKGEQ